MKPLIQPKTPPAKALARKIDQYYQAKRIKDLKPETPNQRPQVKKITWN